MARLSPWSKRYVVPAQWEASVLVQADAYWVQVMIADLEPRKARALYPSDEDHAIAYDAICKAQEALLMDIGERIIMEVRALRGGDAITTAIRDQDSDPFTLPLQTLAGIGNNIDLARAKLEEIRLLIEAGGNGQELLDAVEGIAVLLA